MVAEHLVDAGKLSCPLQRDGSVQGLQVPIPTPEWMQSLHAGLLLPGSVPAIHPLFQASLRIPHTRFYPSPTVISEYNTQ